MACRGVFFAVTPDAAAELVAAADDDELRERIDTIEEAWDADNLAECDKAWDAMHRCLNAGRLECGSEAHPLSQAVLGPRQLHEGDGYIVSLVPADEVGVVASALQCVTRPWFEEQYRTVVPESYAPEYGEEDLEYTWGWFEDVRALYVKAAARGRAVVFTVDQ